MEQQGHSVTNYLTGLVLALILTLLPFWLVWSNALIAKQTFALIAVCAVIQVLVHLKYFLNISFRHTERDYLATLLFAGVLIAIMVGGTIWIMFDLNYRMM